MQGAGNDYIYLNGFEPLPADLSKLARQMSDRHFGVGSDGLVIIMPSDSCDFRMRMFNSDGSEVLQHYTYDNSTMPSNTIYSVCCSTTSNAVYVGTAAGLAEIYSDASQPSSDYDAVYAYPNPVRPEYTGNITIVGLMENSLVKITDAAGNVVRSIQSVGGTAIWDGCNSNGRRVKTGVYFVLTSQSDGSNSSGKVATKILVVN